LDQSIDTLNNGFFCCYIYYGVICCSALQKLVKTYVIFCRTTYLKYFKLKTRW